MNGGAIKLNGITTVRKINEVEGKNGPFANVYLSVQDPVNPNRKIDLKYNVNGEANIAAFKDMAPEGSLVQAAGLVTNASYKDSSGEWHDQLGILPTEKWQVVRKGPVTADDTADESTTTGDDPNLPF